MTFLDVRESLSRVFAASAQGVLFLDAAGQTVFVNSAAASLLGTGGGEASLRRCHGTGTGHVDQEHTDLMKERLPFAEVLTTRCPVAEVCLDVERPDGSRAALIVNASPVVDEAGRVEGVVFVIGDAVRDRSGEKESFSRDGGFRTVFENAPIGIVCFDRDGTITACNESNSRIFGSTRERIIGLNLARDLKDERMRATYETCHFGKVGYFEGDYVSVAGNKPIVARASFVPLYSHTGSYAGGIELVEDITERRVVEDRLDRELKVNRAVAEISASLMEPASSMEKIAAIVLEHAKMITESVCGCVSSIEPGTGDLIGHTILCAGMEEVIREEGRGLVFPRGRDGRYAGPWGRALDVGSAVFFNEPRGHEVFAGLPDSDAFPCRILSVPAIGGDKPVGHIAVANSARDYSEEDIDAVGRLAHLYTLALQRKRTEERIERLASFPELNPYPIIELDFSRKVTYLNLAAEKILEHLSGPPGPEVFFPPDLTEILNACRGEEAQRFYREVRVGEAIFGEDIYRTPGFRVVRIYGRDITEKKRGEDALRAARDLLEAKVRERTKELLAANEALEGMMALLEKVVVAVDQVEEGVAITDRKGLIEYVNPAFERLAGRPRAMLIGERIVEVADGEMRTALETVFTLGEARSGRFRRRKTDGDRRDVEMNVSPVRDLSGEIINYIDVERDITRQVKHEAQRRQAEKLDAISTLASGIAHDFNNIIAGIMGFTEMMLEDTPEESPMHRRLSLVLKGARRGKNLVDQVLSFSRKKIGKVPVSLARAIREAVEAFRPNLPPAVGIHENVPPGDGTILGDYVQIHQMLLNLFSNAVYAMRERGGLIEVSLGASGPAGSPVLPPGKTKGTSWIRVTVRDSGCGMGKTVMERAFEPFFTTREAGEGSGMGLSVVHGIVKRHDGVVKIESEPGKGSTFHIFFPEYEGALQADDEKDAPIPGGTERILVVDDEILVTEMSRQRLERLGYTVSTAGSVAQAVDMISKDPGQFDLVITDYLMPRGTGIDLARAMAGIRPGMPVILCTGFNEAVTKEDMERSGVHDFFMKPVSKGEFARLVRGVLDRSPARKEKGDGEGSHYR